MIKTDRRTGWAGCFRIRAAYGMVSSYGDTGVWVMRGMVLYGTARYRTSLPDPARRQISIHAKSDFDADSTGHGGPSSRSGSVRPRGEEQRRG